MRWGPNPDRQALKKAEFLPVWQKGKSDRFKAREECRPPMALKKEGPCIRARQQPLEAESSPQGQPARQKGPQSYNHMEMNSANNLNELQSGFFPKPLDKNPAQLAPWF